MELSPRDMSFARRSRTFGYDGRDDARRLVGASSEKSASRMKITYAREADHAARAV
jgi:hypothetical protein